MHLAAGDKIAGSVQLRVRWVHSLRAFLNARVHGLEVSGWAHVQATCDVVFGMTKLEQDPVFEASPLSPLHIHTDEALTFLAAAPAPSSRYQGLKFCPL